jgi:pyridoxine/pyridoxamine 5'-phosphate oxidase
MPQTDRGFAPTQDEVNEFLDTIDVCVVSTIGSDGHPMGATVGFSSNAKLECVIITTDSTNKSRNISRDKRVAFTATDVSKRYTVQMQGVARQLSSDEFGEQYSESHYAKQPGALKFKGAPGAVHYVIEPAYLKFSDCSVYPYLVTEFRF